MRTRRVVKVGEVEVTGSERVDVCLDCELERFFAAVGAAMAAHHSFHDRFVEALVFSVDYARAHALFQRLMADQPEVVLPWLTTRSGPLLERAVSAAAPQLAAAVARGEIRRVNPRVAAEWIARLAISLITTPSVTADLVDAARLRRFADELFTVGLTASARGRV
jgi:hypothetical protein